MAEFEEAVELERREGNPRVTIELAIRVTLHTAFDDPTTTADAEPRESIEVRVLLFFDS